MHGRGVITRSQRLGPVIWLFLILGCGDEKRPDPQGWMGVCIDQDGDGYGFQCSAGDDCDDANAQRHSDCVFDAGPQTTCRTPVEGCACDEGAEPIVCNLPVTVTSTNSLLCQTGTRSCRDGRWTSCEGVASFEAPAHLAAIYQGLVAADAATRCSPCRPDCYRVDDPLDVVPDGSTVVPGSSGGITLRSSVNDAGTDAGLLDDTTCSPGVAPDIDCDGVPDVYDPFPSAPPFATDHKTIFLGLLPGQTRSQAFKINFKLNTADVYLYLDMTASMEDERDNLINSLTVGNFLPSGGIGIECADTDFDGLPNLELTTGGIAANIACLIRDVRIGTGWFRDIPFVGPFANGISVAPVDLEPFEHRQDLTSDVVAVLTSLLGFKTRGNHNAPEGSMQGLYALVTGNELYTGWDRPGIPRRTGCPADTWGYPCFRNGAVPIIIHITDAPLQNGPSPTSASRANYLSDCTNNCVCTSPVCVLGVCLCLSGQTCSCPDSTRNPLDYDANVLSGLRGGTESSYRALTSTADTLATAQSVGAIDNVLVTYTGSTAKLASNFTYASAGSCPSGQAAWASNSEGAPDAVFTFTVGATKTLTVASRGSHFDSSIMIRRSDGTVVACSDDASPGDDAEITRSFTAGSYHAIVKGAAAGESGWLQVTLGDKTKQTSGSLVPQRWLGPNNDGANGIRAALLARGVKVITVNSSLDPYLAEQTRAMSTSTGAVDLLGNALTLQIGSNGVGLGLAVLNAVILLANQLAMDVGVVLKEEPDNATPDFGFVVTAIDKLGDGCGPPVDRDGNGIPDTHTNCLPGANPQFTVAFTNRAAPNSVPLKASDPNGGYNMKLQLIGDDTYVVDQIPVYLIPGAVTGSPGVTMYPPSGVYEQYVDSPTCAGTTAPVWRSLSWNASVPSGTDVKFELCSGDTDAQLAACSLANVGTLSSGLPCTTSATCPAGYCDASGVCHFVKGVACSSDGDCGSAGSCLSNLCSWSRSQIDLNAAPSTAGLHGKRKARVRITLDASTDALRAPTVYNWRLDYDCTPML
jgi:hypothetical protein